jgi:tetratricopeptide (TPR) repeat protein
VEYCKVSYAFDAGESQYHGSKWVYESAYQSLVEGDSVMVTYLHRDPTVSTLGTRPQRPIPICPALLLAGLLYGLVQAILKMTEVGAQDDPELPQVRRESTKKPLPVKTAEREPETANEYFARGLSYYSVGEYEKAVADYSETVELTPEDIVAYYHRGLAHKEMGRVVNAISDFGALSGADR